jgi:ankyrin repeat protein
LRSTNQNSKIRIHQVDGEGDEAVFLKLCRQFQEELEQKFGDQNTAILQSTMKPGDSFIADDFFSPYDQYKQPVLKKLPDPVQHAAEQQALEDERIRRRRARRPQVAFRRLVRRGDQPDDSDLPSLTATSGDDSSDTNKTQVPFKQDIYMTTPLHEAARLGAGNFVRFLLAQGGNPNIRNGLCRTALHACAGGLTFEEHTLTCATEATMKETKSGSIEERVVGLRAIFLPEEIFRLMHLDDALNSGVVETKGKKADGSIGLMGRLFGSSRGRKSADQVDRAMVDTCSTIRMQPDPDRLGAITAERMDAMLAILSWVQTKTCDGPSINAVDADGRTALHYAAEMGRSDLCMAVLSNFGAMLTIVDDLGARTPCEVASAQGYKALAAQLEARALLYIDPYGLDDDLLDNMNTVDDGPDPRSRLVPPFKWFRTLSIQAVTSEILQRVSTTRAEMLRAAEEYDRRLVLTATNDVSAISIHITGQRSVSNDENQSQGTSSEDETIEHDENDEAKALLQELTDSLDPGLKSNLTESSTCLAAASSTEGIFNHLQDSHVERYLTFHKWLVAEAIGEFRKHPVEAFIKAAVPLPAKIEFTGKSEERICQICYDDDVHDENWTQMSGCEHCFCKSCLIDYVYDCAKDKKPMFSINCPHHECSAVFSKHSIELLLVNDKPVLESLHKATIETFVTTSDDFKFCPFPACDGIVHRLPHKKFSSNGFDPRFLNYTGAACTAIPGKSEIGDGCTMTYEGVEDLEYSSNNRQPPKAHRFCFACGESVHWPVDCQRLEKWKDKIREEIGDVNSDGKDDDYNDLAQKMWIKANTQKCPSCSVNIEKNDGCNHMICSNPQCLHEFCWICRRDWKLHGTNTGGFFRCNIWQQEDQVEAEVQTVSAAASGDEDGENFEGYGTAVYAAREAWRKKQEMNRFIHHFTRWEAHDQSANLEQKMSDSVCTRLAPVVEAAIEFDGSSVFNFGGQGLSFVHSAFTELLECRSVLRHSYALSYFRYPTFSSSAYRMSHLYGRRKEKLNFERLQSELEVLTEQLSDIVARSHLRATQVQIAFLTKAAAEKRVEFTNTVFLIYRDEKKELARYERRRENEETSSSKSSEGQRTSSGHAFSSLEQILAMHRSGEDRHTVEDDLNNALDGFIDRSQGFEPWRGRRHLMQDDPVRMWACSRCTYVNDGGRLCEMCGHRR